MAAKAVKTSVPNPELGGTQTSPSQCGGAVKPRGQTAHSHEDEDRRVTKTPYLGHWPLSTDSADVGAHSVGVTNDPLNQTQRILPKPARFIAMPSIVNCLREYCLAP